jgi:hypothetical protein
MLKKNKGLWMKKELVSISRSDIDANEIQGFIISESDKLILIQYIYDFKSDGLMVLRKKDISELKTSNTDKFQTQLLKEEGVLSQIDFNLDYDLSSWENFLKAASKKHNLFILEEEKIGESKFNIGKILKIGANKVTMNYFTGVARWLDKPVEIKYKNLTCCQMQNSYLNVYERYFNKKQA